MTPKQVLDTQRFFEEVRDDETILATSPAHRRQLMAILLEILAYDEIAPGFYIKKGTVLQRKYGEPVSLDGLENQWDIDRKEALAALDTNDPS